MPSFDKLRETLGKSGLGKAAADLGPQVAAYALLNKLMDGSISKTRAIGQAVKDIAIWKLVGAAGVFNGVLLGIAGTVRTIVRESGALEASISRLSRMKAMEDMLRPFMGNVGQARARLAQFFQLAARSPFPVPQWVQANRALAILSRGATTGVGDVKLLAKAAENSGNELVDAGLAAGQFYRNLQDGTPVKQAAEELQRMGLISTGTVTEMERMERAGATVEELWGRMQKAIRDAQEPTKNIGTEFQRAQKHWNELKERALAAFGEAFLKAELGSLENMISATQNLIPIMQQLGASVGAFVSVTTGIGTWLAQMITSIPGVAQAVGVLSKAVGGLILWGIGAWVAAWIGALTTGGRVMQWLGAILGQTGIKEALLARAAGQLAIAEKAATAATLERARAQQLATAGDTAGAQAATLNADAQLAAARAATLSAERATLLSTGWRGALSLMVTGIRGLMVALARLALNPVFLAIMAIAWIWQQFAQHNEAVKALEAQAEAAAKLRREIDNLTKSVETLDDANKAMEDLKAKEKDAEAAMDTYYKEHADERNSSLPWKRDDYKKGYEALRQNVKTTRDAQAALAAKRNSGQLGMTEEERALEQGRAERLVNLDRISAKDATRLTDYQNASARFKNESAWIEAQHLRPEEKAKKIREARLRDGNEVLTAEQQVADLRQAGAPGNLIQAAEKRAIFLKSTIEKRGEAFNQWETSGAQPGVSSLQRIAGGGGVGDPTTSLLEKQRALQEQMLQAQQMATSYLATLAGDKSGGPPNQPGDIARPADGPDGGYAKY